ncbi:delta-1-pyrroline-5-carboxylate dehydrogenase [Kalaharituber pfeilii]|nr:delta-1-pyrroline-5-carboxylate dehydrogenase [Kalaharituber pfeilii]
MLLRLSDSCVQQILRSPRLATAATTGAGRRKTYHLGRWRAAPLPRPGIAGSITTPAAPTSSVLAPSRIWCSPLTSISRGSPVTYTRAMATLAAFKLPAVENEPNRHYHKGSADRKGIEDALVAIKKDMPYKIPLVIDGKPITTTITVPQHIPSSHATVLAEASQATPELVQQAIASALKAKQEWERLSFVDRASVFLKAADLISGKYRYQVMAATMLGQGKNIWQAEIDAAAEIVDFLRFNCQYAQELYAQQPVKNSFGVWNRVEYRPLEGFVYAISPFNFTAIGGNLAAAPALLGNVVLWKPSPSAVYSNYLLHKIFLEAGLPPSVIQFIPGDAEQVTNTVLSHPEFASLHYTGSTQIFRHIYGKIAEGVVEGRYRSYPRIVGESGGKNFHLIHSSADISNAVAQTVRGAFEYQGQKCSATSRLYVPKSIWPEFSKRLVADTQALKIGAPDDNAQNFIGPVIHRASFDKLKRVIDDAKNDNELELLTGGKYDDSKGYYVHPTIYVSKNPHHKLFNVEFFGPILGVYVYPDESFAEILKVVDSTGGGYALTGSVFASDRAVLRQAEEGLRYASGNFYLNCKSTGAVVGQQPFGGGRASGTNDKAGSAALLSRFVSMRSVKEEFVGIDRVEYPSNEV